MKHQFEETCHDFPHLMGGSDWADLTPVFNLHIKKLHLNGMLVLLPMRDFLMCTHTQKVQYIHTWVLPNFTSTSMFIHLCFIYFRSKTHIFCYSKKLYTYLIMPFNSNISSQYKVCPWFSPLHQTNIYMQGLNRRFAYVQFNYRNLYL